MISHHDHHRHSAYLLAHVDAAGFSQSQLRRIGNLVLGQRGGLRKMEAALQDPAFALHLLCLRLAVIACHARDDAGAAAIALSVDAGTPTIALDAAWADANPPRRPPAARRGRGVGEDRPRAGAAPGRRRGRLEVVGRLAGVDLDGAGVVRVAPEPAHGALAKAPARRRPRPARALRSRRASAGGRRPGPRRRHPASRRHASTASARRARARSRRPSSPLRPSAATVCRQRSAGLARMRVVAGRRGPSHAAIRSACSRPRAVKARPRSSLPRASSASAWRQRIRSIVNVPRRSVASALPAPTWCRFRPDGTCRRCAAATRPWCRAGKARGTRR